jgi:hypothetical protein
MALNFTPRLSGENSIITSLAAAGLVFGVYSMRVGPVADVHTTDANDINVRASVKKAGWTAVILIGGLFILSQDLNVAILGGGAIILEELNYRHALMANPQTGQITVTPAAYLPAATAPQPVGSTALQTYAGGPTEAMAG